MAGLLFAAAFAGSFFITWLILPLIMGMLIKSGFVRPNFRNEEVPLGVGLVFFLSALVVIMVGRYFGWLENNAYTFLFAVGTTGLFGLVDDVFGSRHASGLKGHFKKLLYEREMTTGALKALAGGFVALMVSLELGEGSGIYRGLYILVNTLMIALSTNAVNLLDLRPGRAGKGFLVFAVLMIILGTGNTQLFFLAVIAGSLAAYLPLDLQGRAMMGDTGSNMLGMTVGYVAVHVLSLPVKLAYLLFLIGFHLLTEKYSLTKIIENNKFLNFIDMLGRK